VYSDSDWVAIDDTQARKKKPPCLRDAGRAVIK
jgi:hypothetical protein